jgi:hypothetical protein
MSGVTPRLSNAGPATYKCGAAVKGGQLVAPHATPGLVQPAGAGSLLVLGVAETDGKPWANPVSTDPDGFETLNANPLPEHTTVGFGRYPVTYTANCAFGQKLQAGANGAVTPVAADVDPRLIVGYCDEPLGVVIATKPVGIANITPR